MPLVMLYACPVTADVYVQVGRQSQPAGAHSRLRAAHCACKHLKPKHSKAAEAQLATLCAIGGELERALWYGPQACRLFFYMARLAAQQQPGASSPQRATDTHKAQHRRSSGQQTGKQAPCAPAPRV